MSTRYKADFKIYHESYGGHDHCDGSGTVWFTVKDGENVDDAAYRAIKERIDHPMKWAENVSITEVKDNEK